MLAHQEENLFFHIPRILFKIAELFERYGSSLSELPLLCFSSLRAST